MEAISRVHQVFDVSEATDEEIEKIKDSLTLACNEALQEAIDLIIAGQFHGCPHTHMIIAFEILQQKFPCNDCSVEMPKKWRMN